MSTSRRVLAAGLAALVALGACSGYDDDDGEARTTTTTASAGEDSGEDSGSAELAPDEDLYAIDGPLPAGEHGTLLRHQEVVPTIMPGTRTWRVLYLSESLEGDAIAVSGTVLVPTAPAPPEGRVVLTVAHGTTGIADDCAPSTHPRLSELSFMATAIEKGWVVALSDYEGMGTPGRHPYLVGESEGRGVLDAALATRELPDADPGARTLIAGYSQGGHGALWAAQLAPTWAPELDILGTFAGAPASEMPLIFNAAPTLPSPAFPLLIFAGYGAAYPDADPAAVLTEAGVERLDVVDTACLGELFDELADEPTASLVRADAGAAPVWSELAVANDPGQVATAAPVLIIHSAEDQLILPLLSDLLAQRMCAAGQVLERRLVTGLGSHGEAAAPAYRDALVWLADRVAGAPAASTCPAR